MAKEIEIETRYTRDATCPYCGYENRDSWELHLDSGHEIEVDCGKCEKTYLVSCDIDITYCSHKKEPA